MKKIVLSLILVFMGWTAFTAYAQNRTIQGTVKESGTTEPVIGASVVVQGTTKGVTTDVDGNFSLQISSSDKALQVSYVGMKEIIIPITAENNYYIMMDANAVGVEEVVVTALGIRRKAKGLTYATQTVGGNELNAVKSVNVANSLQGKSSGLVIAPNSTGAGGSTKIILRGYKSIAGGNQPLIVVDGMPLGSTGGSTGISNEFGEGIRGDVGDALSSLNPDDIESINVLKGASAAALYGSQASNGVLMITTKRGKEGTLRVDFNSNVMMDQAAVMPLFQSDYGQTSPGAKYSWGAKLSQGNGINKGEQVKDYFKTGSTFINSLSIQAGTEKVQSYISYANTYANGILPDNSFMRNNFTMRETFKMFKDKVTLDASANYVQQNGHNPFGGGFYANPVSGLYLFPVGQDINPYLDSFEVWDPARNMMTQNWPNIEDVQGNPNWINQREASQTRRNRLIASLTARYDIADWVNIQARVNSDYSTTTSEQKHYAGSYPLFAAQNGFLHKAQANNNQIYADFLVNFQKTWGDWDFTATAGTSYLRTNNYNTNVNGELFIPNVFQLNNINSSKGVNVTESSTNRVLQGVFATASVNWKQMIYLDVTGRNDWASTLAFTSTDSYFYPAVGLTGVISEMVNLGKSINLLKVRGSYSEVGNDLPAYRTYPMNRVQGSTVIENQTIPFVELKPERQTSIEAGFDLAMFKNRFYLDFTWYKTNTKNQLFSVAAPVASGYTNYYVNAGNIQNSGVEVTASLRNDFGKNWSWNTGINYSVNANKVVEVDDRINNQLNLGGAGAQLWVKKGGSYGDIYGQTVDRDANGVIKLNDDGSPKRVNDQYLGNINPKWMLSWNNTIRFKNAHLYFLIDSKFGGKVVSFTQSLMDQYGVSAASGAARDAGGVPRGDGTMINAEKYYTAVGGRSNAIGEYVFDASNIRMREISVGYTFKDLCGPSRNLELSLIGRNLFFFYKNSPVDPDSSLSTAGGWSGYDIFSLPGVRNYGLNVKLSF